MRTSRDGCGPARVAMPAGYAPAKTAYRELRAAVTPWAKSQGFRRWPGTQAGWQKAVDAGRLLGFKFEGDGMVNPDTGNSMHGLVQLEDARQDSLLGLHLRELYDPAPQYREGQSVEPEYYSIEDVRDFVTFIVAVLPGVLDRFLEGRIAKAIDTTPPHLQPAWLRRLPPSSV